MADREINASYSEKAPILSSTEKKSTSRLIRKRTKSYFKGLIPPIIKWAPKYKKTDIRGDILAGLTVGITLVPQSMAYATVAGLPVIYGLYSSVIPILLYSVFGTSPHITGGPVAIMSLLTKQAVLDELAAQGKSASDTTDYIQLALLLSMLVGLILWLVGLLKLGFLADLISDPVRNGFNSASAITIAMSQLPSMFGMKLPTETFEPLVIYEIFKNIHNTNWYAVALAVLCCSILLSWKFMTQKFKRFPGFIPAALVVVIICIALSWPLKLHQRVDLPIVGDIPKGLPPFHVPAIPSFDTLLRIIPSAATIAVVSFANCIAIAAKFAEQYGYKIDPNQELVSYGILSFVGSFFSSFTTSASLSRTAINTTAGGNTQIVGFVVAGVISLTLLFLTPLIYPLPIATLASIVIIAVYPLVEVKIALELWREKKRDLFIMILTFVVTLTVGISQGLMAGVAVSILVLVYDTMYPDLDVLGNVPGTEIYKSIKKHPECTTNREILILRIGQSMNFTNMGNFKNKITQIHFKKPLVKAIIVDMSCVFDIDSSALRVLRDTIEVNKRQKVSFNLAALHQTPAKMLDSSGIMQRFGSDNVFPTVHDAYLFYSAKYEIPHAYYIEISDEPPTSS